jgi:uncharacterized membrane protein
MAAKNVKERLEAKKKRQNVLIIVVLAGIALTVILVAGFIWLSGSQGGDQPTYNQSLLDEGGQNVLIPLSDITDNSFHFYSFDFGGTVVKYFLVKDAGGNIHSAFDACDVCYKSKKGYRQSGDYAQCNNCGRTFSTIDIGTKNTGGGCWPGYLPQEVQGDNIIIKRSELEGGQHYF